LFDVILTTDRTMMTNHHGKEFLGFMATGPALGLPEPIWLWICAPKMKTDDVGRVWQAPYGMRKVEAVLMDAGFEVATIDPDHLDRHVKHAKVLLLSHHDYFALCPPSSEWWSITRKEPVNAKSFRRLMERPSLREAKRRGLKIIAGGPAAWQWLWKIDKWVEWGVDTVVDGEAEKVVVDLVSKALNDEPLPRYVYVGVDEVPKLEEIPTIKHASINGLIEVTRGCPRNCRFCSVTLRPLRHYTFDMIEQELKVNVSEGVTEGIIHSEDVLLYGSRGVEPEPDAVIKLHKLVKSYYKKISWSHASLSAIKRAEEKYKLVTKVREIICDDNQDYWGVEVGIETGSVKLAKKIMPAKSAPYPAEMWPQVVEDAFAIMHENNIIPAATLILGLPEETEDDVMRTAELLDRLRPYRSLIVPMFFVPMGYFKTHDWFTRVKIRDEHVEVMKRCLDHALYWASDIMNKFYLRGRSRAPLRWALRLFLAYVRWRTRNIDKKIEKWKSRRDSS